MEPDVKGSMANLMKLPAKEFEQHFREWMERDDIARALQAKLRCDLIKNFNKTHLGKQMMNKSLYSNVNSSAYRLTLSPIILVLNTLVAEFLYASNCHYALSVFCTEVAFGNTLPDFERMKDFRFNDLEIKDIWEAITGTSSYHKSFHHNIAKIYHSEYENSLLLAILKHLLKQRPDEMCKRTIEVQTDLRINDNATEDSRAQISDSGDHAATTTPLCKHNCQIHRDENLAKFKKYVQILSHHTSVMIDKLDEFDILKKSFERVRRSKSARFRDYQRMGRSLERISENLKQSAFAKRRNRKQEILIEAIDNLTVEFNKCAEQFKDLQKHMKWSKDTAAVTWQSTQDKQTETINVERSYNQWIYEMRNTVNGQKFLNRIETSLNKAVNKHKEHVENEMKTRAKHIRKVLKLHYEQKLLRCLSTQSFKEDNIEIQKLNEHICKKLCEFELKQTEILEKMHKSTANSCQSNDTENVQQSHLNVTEDNHMDHIANSPIHMEKEKIYNAKLRLEELQNESDRLEKNFLQYFESQKEDKMKILSQHKIYCLHLLHLIRKFLHKNKQMTSEFNIAENSDDENYLDMKRKLQLNGNEKHDRLHKVEQSVSTSSEELDNAIITAKLHFYEEKQRFRQNRQNKLLQEMSLTAQKEENKLEEKLKMFYTNTTFHDDKSSGDLCVPQMHNKANNDGDNMNNTELKHLNENCDIFNKNITTTITATTTTTTTTTTTKTEAVIAAQYPRDVQDENHLVMAMQSDMSSMNVVKPIKISQENMSKAFITAKQNDCLPHTTEANIVMNSMNKIQKLFEQNTVITTKTNGSKKPFTEIEEISSNILLNFTKSLEERLLPDDKYNNAVSGTMTAPTTVLPLVALPTSPPTTVIAEKIETTIDKGNIALEEMNKEQRISNVSMPSFVSITSSSSSNNFENDMNLTSMRPFTLKQQYQQYHHEHIKQMDKNETILNEMSKLSENLKHQLPELNESLNNTSQTSSDI